MPTGRQALPAGFSLIELLVLLSIAVLVIVSGTPAVATLIYDQRLSTGVNAFAGHLRTARLRSVERNGFVVLCTTDDHRQCSDEAFWESGWLLFDDPDRDRHCRDLDGDSRCDADGGRIIAAQPPLADGVTLRGNHFVRHRIRFSGRAYTSGFANGTFTLCDHRGIDHARGLVLHPVGRLRQARPEDLDSCLGA